MLHFDLNISITMKELPLLERLDAAARLGFGAVELWWPEGADLRALARRARDAELAVALFNFHAGDLGRGERGLLNDPHREQEFRSSVPAALDLAQATGCTRINALVGCLLAGTAREAQLDRVRTNLTWACEQAAAAGVTVVVEALNAWETPGYLCTNTIDTLALIDSVGAPNLLYQYDVYHMQRMEGNIAATVAAHGGRMGHIQVADSPERHQPGTGELHFPYIFAAIAASAYRGYVGLEYVPRGPLAETLAWLPADRRGPIEVASLGL